MHVVIIGGASTIGATVTYTLMSEDPTLNITLVDKEQEAAWAHSTDIIHSVFHSVQTPLNSDTANSFGTVRVVGSDELSDLKPDLLIFTAAAPRPDDATDTDAREAELEANRSIVDDVAAQLQSVDPAPVLVLTNPIDRITYLLYQRLEWSRKHFLGYSLSETARTAFKIGEIQDAHPATVYCPVMGEHGDGTIPIFSKLRIHGESVTLSDEEQAEVLEYVREIPFEIAKCRGASETSRWVTSAGVARLIRTMISGGTEREPPICLSTPVDGEYGLSDGCLSVPITLTTNGVGEILEWELAPDEQQRLQQAHDEICDDLRDL
jgi:malate dehydrogenase